MANMTLTIPDKLRKCMEKRPEVRWSAVAREAIEKRVEELDWLDSVLSRSELTEEDAERIGNAVKEEMSKRFHKRFGKWK